MSTWQVRSNDPNYLNNLSIASGSLVADPTGDSIVFTTDIIDISDYFDIDLEALIANQLSDSIRIYFELDGGPRTRFETNGAVVLTNNLWANKIVFLVQNMKNLMMIRRMVANYKIATN